MQYFSIGEQAFREKTFKLISKFETFEDKPYFDKFNSIAIGYGFDIVVNSYNDVDKTIAHWKNVFKDASFISEIDIEKILKSPYLNNISINDALYKINQHVTAEQNKKDKTKHSYTDDVIKKLISLNFVLASESDGKKVLNNLLYNIPDSYSKKLIDRLKEKLCDISEITNYTNEQAALLSMVYNAGKGIIGKNFSQALRDSDRFRAWFEIRYCSNSSKSFGIARRRIAESNIFGLYENHQANNLIYEYKLDDIKNDMMTFTDILHVFSNLNIKNTPYEQINYLAYMNKKESKKDYSDKTIEDKYKEPEFSPKNDAYYPVKKLLSPLLKYVNHLFGNKYTDSQGKIIESFDLDKIFVIDKNTININSKAMQNILNSKISAFNSQKKKDENSGNTIKSETINFLLILKDRNATDIDFGQILSKNEFCSITLVLLEDNGINFNNVSTENLNILCINPQNPSEFKNIKGNFQVENDDDSIISLKSIENGLNAIYKKLEGCLSIFDDLGNKLVDIINHTPGSSKAAIELPELQYSYEVVSNRVNGNFTYICNIELVGKIKNSKEEIVGLPFYLYSSYTDEILETTIQKKDDKLQAVFNFALDENKLETQKIMCSIDRSELENKRKSNQYPSHASGISKTEQQDGKKEGKYACSTNLRVDKCKIISSTVESVKVEAIYNLNTESEQYQEQIKNTQWCYYITDSYSPNKVPKDEAKGHALPNKGKIIEVKLNDLDLKYTPDKTIYFFPYLKQPSARVYDLIIGKVINYHVTACKVVTDSDGEFQVEAVYNIKNMVIDEEVNNNTKWLIVAIESHVPTHEHLSILSKYDGLSIEKINTEETDKETNDKYQIPQDYQIENTTGSILNFKLKDNSSWQTKSVYFLPYKSKIDVDIKALWDLSQPFYLKYTGNKLQVINKYGKLEFEKAAYGGYTLESSDLYGDPVKLGRYNVFYNASLLHANHNTLGLYQDKMPVLGEKRMLIKAGGNILYTCSGICLYNSYLDRKISEHSPLYHRSYVGIRTLLPTLIKGSTASPKYMDTIENIKINTEDIT